GSEPTPKSNMYNISASYYQPQLNQPLLMNKTTVVRACAIGAGKENSPVASITVSFGGALFSDLAGYEPVRPAIEALAAKGVISGTGDSRFDPAGSLTRAMFVTMLGRALNGGTGAAAAGTKEFTDVDYGSWYGPHIHWAVKTGIVSGYPDGTFKPHQNLTVEEMIVMAVRASGLKPGKVVAISGVSEWAKPLIMIAENHHMLVRGYLAEESAQGIAVKGFKQASRAEAALLLYQLLQALNKL
ncbi:MAG: S-layer homology domain-containing protein, partial [Clostridiales bacterium]|nr:S-layer homology domain-containing protein [Clostridiales bacterium]